MDNKILILLMSCNSQLYRDSEQACRETFITDAEKAGVRYYFYRGDAEETSINDETHEMLFPVNDNLAGTARKTILAFKEALKLEDWDYIVKTNVSTWLDVRKIQKAVNAWEGREDLNIYGARFLVNSASKNVPFPRGHFLILSRKLVEGIVEWGPRFIGAKDFPRTDDTLLCLSLLYYVQKILGDNYQSRLTEVPSVISWSEEIQDSVDWGDALSVRCKDETDGTNTPDHLRKTHKLKRTKNLVRAYRRPVRMFETKYGTMAYDTYIKTDTIIETVKAREKEAASIEQDREDKLLKIREMLDAIRTKNENGTKQ